MAPDNKSNEAKDCPGKCFYCGYDSCHDLRDFTIAELREKVKGLQSLVDSAIGPEATQKSYDFLKTKFDEINSLKLQIGRLERALKKVDQELEFAHVFSSREIIKEAISSTTSKDKE